MVGEKLHGTKTWKRMFFRKIKFEEGKYEREKGG